MQTFVLILKITPEQICTWFAYIESKKNIPLQNVKK